MKRLTIITILFALLCTNAFSQDKQFLYIEFTPTDATLEITDEGATLTAKVYRDAQLGGDVEYTMTYKGEILAVQAEEFEE